MPLLNYTTEVPVATTAGRIRALLIKAGARAIAESFDTEGNTTGLEFMVEGPGQGVARYRLPIRSGPVLAVLQTQRVERRYRSAAQAERVAWRIVEDWVKAQLAIIQTEMVTLREVMLPYMIGDEGRTVFEVFEARRQVTA